MRKVFFIQFFVFLFLAALINMSYADDAPILLSGGVAKLIEGEEPDISMDSEVVTIEFGEKEYTVDAVFEFFNHGETKTIKVGFPNYGGGHVDFFKGTSGVGILKEFQTWINDKESNFEFNLGYIKLNFREVIDNPDEIKKIKEDLSKGIVPEQYNYCFYEETNWFVRDIIFKENEITKTRVRYKAPFTGPGHEVEYILGTGKHWKGNIKKAVFIVKYSPKKWVKLLPRFCDGKRFSNERDYKTERISAFEFKIILDNIEPFTDEVLRIFAGSGNTLPWSSYGDCFYKDKEIPDAFLDVLSPWHLKLLRNWYFALHGRIFKSPELDRFFRGPYRRWYKPRADYKESDLTEIQKANVKKIFEYEKRMKDVLKIKE